MNASRYIFPSVRTTFTRIRNDDDERLFIRGRIISWPREDDRSFSFVRPIFTS